MKKQQTESDKLDKQHWKILKRCQKNQPRIFVKRVVKEYEENVIQPLRGFQDDYKPEQKQTVKEYEENIIQPPLEFRDDFKQVPKPRTKTTTKKPVQYPRTQITPHSKVLKSGVQTFKIGIKNQGDALVQFYIYWKFSLKTSAWSYEGIG